VDFFHQPGRDRTNVLVHDRFVKFSLSPHLNSSQTRGRVLRMFEKHQLLAGMKALGRCGRRAVRADEL
jgi:hypothetical protein